MTAGGTGGGVTSTLVSVPRIKIGFGSVPLATVEAITARPNGDARTLTWPKPSSARSVRSVAAGTEPVTVVMPGMTKSRPTPNCLAVLVNASGAIPEASFAKLVLQEKAYAACIVMTPLSNVFELG